VNNGREEHRQKSHSYEEGRDKEKVKKLAIQRLSPVERRWMGTKIFL
jgi:hypothetical protein